MVVRFRGFIIFIGSSATSMGIFCDHKQMRKQRPVDLVGDFNLCVFNGDES